jgi:TonB family protein
LRCAECEMDPLTPAQFCECCGRKHTAAAPVAPAPEPTAPAERVAGTARCESCGGPCDNASLCASCQRAFQEFLDPNPKTAASDLAVTAAEATPAVEASPATGLAQSGPVADAPHWFDVALAALPASAVADAAVASPHDVQAAEAEAVKAEVARAEAARVEAAEAEAARLHAAQAEAERIEVARVEATKIKAAQEQVVKEAAARAQAAKAAQIETRRRTPTVATPPATRASNRASIHSRRRTGSMVRVAAAVVIVAASLGLGGYWFKIQELSFPGQTQQTPAAPTATVAERVSTSHPPVAKKTAKAREVATSRVDPARVPPAVPSTWPVASAPVNVIDVPVYEATTPEPTAVVPSPPAPSAAPLGPFFEATDVNVAPQVASRVAPQLPDGLRARELHDIVVVHLLVSQSGQPSNVSLLRRSQAGRSVDDAVVTAVKQWTFSPARKKGEAVSCWFNVGVPVGRTN